MTILRFIIRPQSVAGAAVTVSIRLAALLASETTYIRAPAGERRRSLRIGVLDRRRE
jgi:hypothetical protein